MDEKELDAFGGEFVGLELFSQVKQDWILIGLGMLSGLMEFYMLDNSIGESLRIIRYDLDTMQKDEAKALINKARSKMREQAMQRNDLKPRLLTEEELMA